MAFYPNPSEWVESHYCQVPRQTAEMCGSLKGLRVLDVGCGDMLSDFGLLTLGSLHITGLDLHDPAWDVVEAAACTLDEFGIMPAAGHRSRLRYQPYDGGLFPFPNASFDFVFSWSAFEHIADPPAVLAEIYRVVKPGGRVFIQVFPWFPCFHGSHLTDFITEPYFHLRHSQDWTRDRLNQYAAEHPELADFLREKAWMDFGTLNGYSSTRFFDDLRRAGFSILRSQLIVYDQDVSQAPVGFTMLDLMVSGSMVLLAPKQH